ncbi:cytosolic carboxypeptidase [Acrasis kona]|uniref:Cytosolic carboxypeptidase n=1 Tax=Acrasis kona TaxID=1008807 RepID=A0AAW2ZJ48_9EUKA
MMHAVEPERSHLWEQKRSKLDAIKAKNGAKKRKKGEHRVVFNKNGTTSKIKKKTDLKFDSSFESGNLAKATRISKYEYELELSFDNDKGHFTQWFYFSVRRMVKGRTYKFNIINFYKSGSSFRDGMKPLSYSEVKGWRRRAADVKYYEGEKKKDQSSNYNILTWTYKQDHDVKKMFFCHCYPYTYSDLCSYLEDVKLKINKNIVLIDQVLSKTVDGRDCKLLTVTSSGDDSNKQGVVITARVHPGESNASYMMKGVLDFLLSDDEQAQALRNLFVFKIVPMLNPDGVFKGNYRCNSIGQDLNRHYDDPSLEMHPVIVNLKTVISDLVKERGVLLYCDLHGHSTKRNVFMYGCSDESNVLKDNEIKVFPKMMSMQPMFSYKDCSFNLDQVKTNTGRIVMFQKMGIMNSYTMESSFGITDKDSPKAAHLNRTDFENMGKSLLKTLYLYQTQKHIVDQVRDDLLRSRGDFRSKL